MIKSIVLFQEVDRPSCYPKYEPNSAPCKECPYKYLCQKREKVAFWFSNVNKVITGAVTLGDSGDVINIYRLKKGFLIPIPNSDIWLPFFQGLWVMRQESKKSVLLPVLEIKSHNLENLTQSLEEF